MKIALEVYLNISKKVVFIVGNKINKRIMKKVLLAMVLLATLPISAQEINLTESGAYEKKEVVVVDSVKASVLFGRAMEALSDWTGTDGRSRAGLDYHDKESGTLPALYERLQLRCNRVYK